jgi:hypothetical protein
VCYEIRACIMCQSFIMKIAIIGIVDNFLGIASEFAKSVAVQDFPIQSKTELAKWVK